MSSKNMSPMMQEYCKTKEKYKDCVLFYRLGDFYEMFFDDALLVSKEQLSDVDRFTRRPFWLCHCRYYDW